MKRSALASKRQLCCKYGSNLFILPMRTHLEAENDSLSLNRKISVCTQALFSALNTLQPSIISLHLRLPKSLRPRQFNMHIRDSGHLELYLLLRRQLQHMPTKRAIITNEMQMLARDEEPLPGLRTPKPHHRALHILVLANKLRLTQLTQWLTRILLPLDSAALIMTKRPRNSVRHEQILHMRINTLKNPIHSILVLKLHVQRVLGHELRTGRVGDLVGGVCLADLAARLQLVAVAVEEEEFAVHAHKGAEAVVAFGEERGDRDAAFGDAGHQRVDQGVLIDVVGFELRHGESRCWGG